MRGQIGAGVRSFDKAERNKFIQEQEQERLAPIRAAEAELTRTAGQLRKVEKERALNGTDDPAFVRSLLSEPMKTIRLASAEEANEHNLRAGEAFMASNPDYYASPTNARLLTGYCLRNDVFVCDAETYGNVYRHLDSLGLMEHQPAPQPEPVTIIEQEPVPAKAAELMGFDDNGRPKAYTAAEVERMSADAYRRYFRIPTKEYVAYQESQTRW
jgi:hypothetical protein